MKEEEIREVINIYNRVAKDIDISSTEARGTVIAALINKKAMDNVARSMEKSAKMIREGLWSINP